MEKKTNEIPAGAERALQDFALELGTELDELDGKFAERFAESAWPDNVATLKGYILERFDRIAEASLFCSASTDPGQINPLYDQLLVAGIEKTVQFLQGSLVHTSGEYREEVVSEMRLKLNGRRTRWIGLAKRKHLGQRPAPILDLPGAATAAPSSGSRDRTAFPAARGRARPTPALKWEDVDISLLSDERIQVQIVSQRATCNYAEFGCVDQRTGRANKVWEMLKTLARAHGVIPDINRTDTKGWPAMEKRLERLRKLLKYQFHLSEDPLPFRRGTGYRLRCKIGNAASFDT
jgi:hypothetical protein